MPTIEDVARLAGVSVGTVSNVLNNRKTVSQKNVNRVAAAIRQLHYTPNAAARTLKTNRSRSIGLVLPDITNPFYPEVARGVEDIVKRQGYSLFLCNKDRSAKTEGEYIQVLMEKNVDGIILIKPRVDRATIERMAKACKVVLVDTAEHGGENCGIVNTNDTKGAALVMQALYNLGHRRIAFISGTMDGKSDNDRFAQYSAFMEAHGIAMEELVERGVYSIESGFGCTMRLLERERRPTAIFAANDICAVGALQAVRDRGLRVPEDVSIAGYDDIPMSAYLTPPLTTVKRPKYELGYAAATLMVNAIENGTELGGASLWLETELVERRSTGEAMSLDPEF